MPIYEYQCTSCGACFELMQKISDGPPKECPSCGHKEVRKLLSKVGFQLKGTGWYETDFKNKKNSKKPEKTEIKTLAIQLLQKKKRHLIIKSQLPRVRPSDRVY